MQLATMCSVDEVAGVIAGTRALALTGAGMSTASGIPDYRGPDGSRRVKPMQYDEFVSSADARRTYWARSYIGYQKFNLAGPNAAHRAVTRLQQAGHVGAVITQNVDGLHQRAGTTDVVELHGSLDRVVCLTCGDRSNRWTLGERMRQANPGFEVTSDEIRPDGDLSLQQIDVERFIAPRCGICGRDTLKPDVVFFGESVPKPMVEDCFRLTDETDVLVALGTSLTVMSGYRFVRRAAARGIPIVLVTHGPTRGDPQVTHRLDADLSDCLGQLCAALGLPG